MRVNVATYSLCELHEAPMYGTDLGHHIVHYPESLGLSNILKIQISPIRSHLSEKPIPTSMFAIEQYTFTAIFR